MKPPETIETARLILRLPDPADASILFQKYMQDKEVTKYLIWRPHESMETALSFIEGCILAWKEGSRFPWVVVRKSDKEIIGMIEMRIKKGEADIGYVVTKE
jgi:RimJ/RimL family protein N-acetyltransferase